MQPKYTVFALRLFGLELALTWDRPTPEQLEAAKAAREASQKSWEKESYLRN